MKSIIFATTNKGKIREIGQMTEDKDVNIYSLADIGFEDDVEETGKTFEDNAVIKAEAVAEYVKNNEKFKDAIVLADDSGLCIDYYDGAPGVYSHRWLGERTYTQAMQDVMKDMQDVPDEKRGARFVCSMAAVVPAVGTLTVCEKVEGRIAYELAGENGFGYDPFFYVPELGCTTAQLSPEAKNDISHRGKALRAVLKKIEDYL